MKDNLKQLLFSFDYALVEPGHEEEAHKALKNFVTAVKKANKEIRVSGISSRACIKRSLSYRLDSMDIISGVGLTLPVSI